MNTWTIKHSKSDEKTRRISTTDTTRTTSNCVKRLLFFESAFLNLRYWTLLINQCQSQNVHLCVSIRWFNSSPSGPVMKYTHVVRWLKFDTITMYPVLFIVNRCTPTPTHFQWNSSVLHPYLNFAWFWVVRCILPLMQHHPMMMTRGRQVYRKTEVQLHPAASTDIILPAKQDVESG